MGSASHGFAARYPFGNSSGPQLQVNGVSPPNERGSYQQNSCSERYCASCLRADLRVMQIDFLFPKRNSLRISDCSRTRYIRQCHHKK